MQRQQWTKAISVLGAILFASSALSEEADPLRAFLASHHCEIVGRLGQIHASPDKKARYIVLSDASQPEHYVQCLFIDGDTRMLCEIASGFYQAKQGEERVRLVSPQGLSALERLGFSADDSEGNFQVFANTATAADFPAVAELMLTALYRAYEKRRPPRLKIDAPQGPGGRAMRAQCAPVS